MARMRGKSVAMLKRMRMMTQVKQFSGPTVTHGVVSEDCRKKIRISPDINANECGSGKTSIDNGL
jgi:hypothetical protein